jgi:nitrogen regulatory protein PII
MKRIEAVIKPWTLDEFKEAAPSLGISDFDVIEVYCSRSGSIEGRHLYRGSEYSPDLLPHLRLEFVVFDDDLESMLQNLFELVHPESVAIFTVDHTIRQAIETPPRCSSKNSLIGSQRAVGPTSVK